jgi:hypothetical protein
VSPQVLFFEENEVFLVTTGQGVPGVMHTSVNYYVCVDFDLVLVNAEHRKYYSFRPVDNVISLYLTAL